ncbi:Crp/Fnr family transcriptional regulator [Robertkochia sediminum]|uniref:Crp/Fnr family transcriptional regulator n=1 Tax=Robertkochia sediminum TaxID=2785326 RepID=UPI001931D126|nr:Crp/Fnr family transcriptional regulator [Robertkochia sediminum]MBL7472528.1 Crp/Fnr family transcriptional regulator [Robertkochia sediminum]
MNTLWFFEGVNLFDILCPHKYENFKRSHQVRSYHRNDYVYFEQERSGKVYLVEKGKVRLGYYTEPGEEVVKAVLTRGEIFGEKALLDSQSRNEFAQVIDNETVICAVSADTLQELMRENKTFSLQVYKFIGFRFRKLERRLRLLLFKDSRTRLIEFLKELCEEYGDVCREGGFRHIRHPYTQKDMASLIGTSRPTLNVLLNELKEEGVLEFSRKEIKLWKDPASVS